jgi:hypothetical protein
VRDVPSQWAHLILKRKSLAHTHLWGLFSVYDTLKYFSEISNFTFCSTCERPRIKGVQSQCQKRILSLTIKIDLKIIFSLNLS